MFKKITAGVATLAISVGIINTASATELIQPTLSITNPIEVSTSSDITPYAASLLVTRYDYFDKAKYPASYMTPDTYFTTEISNGNYYGGSIPKVAVEASGLDFWKVTYKGRIPIFQEY